jgi:putative ABC transport system permease protein
VDRALFEGPVWARQLIAAGYFTMSFFELIRLVFGNLMRMKARLVMTSAGVVIGTTSVIMLISLGIGLQESTLKMFGDIAVLSEIEVAPNGGQGNPEGPQAQPQVKGLKPRKLDRAAIKEIEALPGVSVVIPMLRLESGGQLKYNRKIGYGDVRGIAPDKFEKLGFKLAAGAGKLANGQMIVGGWILGSFNDPNAPPPSTFVPITDSTSLLGKKLEMQIYKFDPDGLPIERLAKFNVSSVLLGSIGGSQRDFSVYLSEADVIELNAWSSGKRLNPARDGYPSLTVRTVSTADTARVQRQILEMGFTANSQVDTIKSLNDTFRTIQTVLGAIGAVALLVSAFGIANTMVMAIYERSREIGLMKAVGATHSDIMFIFLGESAAIGLIGGIVGTIVSLIAGRALTSLLSGGQGGNIFGSGPIQIITPVWLVVAGIALAMVVGLIAGAYPALRTTRLDPIVALKSDA